MKLTLTKVQFTSNRTSVGNVDYMMLVMTDNVSALFFNESLGLSNFKKASPQTNKGIKVSVGPELRPFQEIFNVCVAKCTCKYC